ncbi:MAG TPA: hypothetical protein VGF29_04825, partial [Hyphomicrobiaceae bacterium]
MGRRGSRALGPPACALATLALAAALLVGGALGDVNEGERTEAAATVETVPLGATRRSPRRGRPGGGSGAPPGSPAPPPVA